MYSGPIRLRGRPLLAGSGPFIFGILNCTPDSFSDGGKYLRSADAIAAGLQMARDGADAIDVGGESTRPGSQPVPPDEQIRRTREVIAALVRSLGDSGPAVSIDTRSSQVAKAALDAGASIVNDVSALRDDPDMAQVVVDHHAGLVLMHMQGTPATMQIDPQYDDVVVEVGAFLASRVSFAISAGIPRDCLIVDPGIGFGKTSRHNLMLLSRVNELATLNVPIMVGASRKRFISQLVGDSPEQRLCGSLATVASCVLAGVECLRVHDVAACRSIADMCRAIRDAQGNEAPDFLPTNRCQEDLGFET
jgi:dihydropteroate synthase